MDEQQGFTYKRKLVHDSDPAACHLEEYITSEYTIGNPEAGEGVLTPFFKLDQNCLNIGI